MRHEMRDARYETCGTRYEMKYNTQNMKHETQEFCQGKNCALCIMHCAFLSKAATYASRCEHCESEVREKLLAWGATNEEADKIIAYLIEERYVNNQRYANSYAKDKFRFNHWGKYKIGMMLRSKDIESGYIEEALEQIDEEEYLEKLQEILHDKLRTLKYSSEYEKKGKLFKFAQSRGFESSAISKVIDSI